jgi:membrane protein YdbS with pleckstrin-like domain
MEDSGFTFRGQRPDEKVADVIRRHPIIFFWPLLQATLGLAVGIIVLIYAGFGDIFLIVGFIALLFIFSVIFKIWFIYSNSFCLITNQRVINVDQRGFFNRVITETEFSKIQDVTNSTNGMIGTSLNFGEVAIQTAGKENKLLIKFVPDPYSVQQEITKHL